MDLVRWDDKYSVQVGEIDDQHKKLFSIINRLFDHMKVGKAKDIIEETINELLEYTNYHFSSEEKYMLEFKYEGYEKQKKAHEFFVSKITSFKEEIGNYQGEISSDICMFLVDWLREHILEEDTKYVALFKENGL